MAERKSRNEIAKLVVVSRKQLGENCIFIKLLLISTEVMIIHQRLVQLLVLPFLQHF